MLVRACASPVAQIDDVAEVWPIPSPAVVQALVDEPCPLVRLACGRLVDRLVDFEHRCV